MESHHPRGVQGGPSGQKVNLGIGWGSVQEMQSQEAELQAKRPGLTERGFELRAQVGKARPSELSLLEFEIESRRIHSFLCDRILIRAVLPTAHQTRLRT